MVLVTLQHLHLFPRRGKYPVIAQNLLVCVANRNPLRNQVVQLLAKGKALQEHPMLMYVNFKTKTWVCHPHSTPSSSSSSSPPHSSRGQPFASQADLQGRCSFSYHYYYYWPQDFAAAPFGQTNPAMVHADSSLQRHQRHPTSAQTQQ